MLLGQRLGSERAVQSDAPPAGPVATLAIAEPADDVDQLERALMAAISQIVGVGNAEVLIVPKTSEVRVFAEEITQRTSLTQHAGDGGTGHGGRRGRRASRAGL